MEDKDKKFYTARSDRGFKEIFLKETNRDLLIKLLETILHVEIHSVVEENIERNQRNLGVRRKNLDVLIDTNQGLIGIEVNSYYKDYLHVRNFAFLCDIYSHYTLVGEEYTEDIQIMQINFSYDIGNKDNKLFREYYVQDNEQEKFVNNCTILELNMDNIMKFWYSKDKKKINEYKYLIMLDLELNDLKRLSNNDKLVNKFMDNLEELNEDPVFREYMTKEEDMRKCHNSDLRIAREEGIKEGTKQANVETAKKMISKDKTIEEIQEFIDLSLEEIEKLKENLSA